MNRKEQLIALRGLTTGSWTGRLHHNTIYLSEDLKRMVLFHTSDCDIHDYVRKYLFMCCCPYEAIKMWSSFYARKVCNNVNVFSTNLEDIPVDWFHWNDGDNYEIYHGGRSVIYDIDKLKFEVYCSKLDLFNELERLGYHAIYNYDTERLYDYFIFNKDYEEYLLKNIAKDNYCRELEEYNTELYVGMFYNQWYISRLRDSCVRLSNGAIRYRKLFQNNSSEFNW